MDDVSRGHGVTGGCRDKVKKRRFGWYPYKNRDRPKRVERASRVSAGTAPSAEKTRKHGAPVDGLRRKWGRRRTQSGSPAVAGAPRQVEFGLSWGRVREAVTSGGLDEQW